MSDLSPAVWRKSRRSGSGNNCVEVARFAGVVAFRDSKNPDGGFIALPVPAARAFVRKAAQQ